jgi:hypothetical protein
VEERAVVVTGYQRDIRIQWLEGEHVEKGDRLSFVVRRKSGEKDYIPEKVRVHGKADLKYALSFLAVAWVLFSCFFHIRIDKKALALKFNTRRRTCQTD